MEKISNAKIATVLSDAAAALRAQQTKIAALESELASRNTHDRAEKLAFTMREKGLELDTEPDALIDRLEKAAADGKLDTIETAVGLVGPDMGTKLAQLASKEELRTTSESGASDFERFVLGDAG